MSAHYFLIGILVMIILVSIAQLYRNNKVCDCQIRLINSLLDYDEFGDSATSIYYSVMPSYHRMLWSFKNLNAWEKEIMIAARKLK